MENLITISYRSRAKPSISMWDVDAIAADSHPRNVARGTTGMLLFDGEFFMQTIEGKAPETMNLFTSISEDNRHENVIPFGIQRIEERDFPDWHMGLLEPEETASIIPDMKSFEFSYKRLREVQAMAIEVAVGKRPKRTYH